MFDHLVESLDFCYLDSSFGEEWVLFQTCSNESCLFTLPSCGFEQGFVVRLLLEWDVSLASSLLASLVYSQADQVVKRSGVHLSYPHDFVLPPFFSQWIGWCRCSMSRMLWMVQFSLSCRCIKLCLISSLLLSSSSSVISNLQVMKLLRCGPFSRFEPLCGSSSSLV